VNAKDDEGYTPLYWAASRGYKVAVKLLLDYKADFNAKTNNGETPLGIAIQNHHDGVAELLRAHGAKE
jgi:ankyrin repeat protein